MVQKQPPPLQGLRLLSSSESPQERGERIDCQVCRMTGSFGNSPNFLQHVFPAHLARVCDSLALGQLCDGRATSHGCNAAFGAKADVSDAIAI